MAITIRHANPSHILATTRTFFITSSIAQKRNMLQSDRSAHLFIQVLYNYRGQNKFLLHEFVAMPDHLHALLTVDSSMTIERTVQLIKGGFAFRAGKELGFRAPVWQRGFSENRVQDADAFQNFARYIHENPVRRHLASSAAEFPYSSALPGFELDAPPLGLKPTLLALHNGMAKAMP